MVQRFMAWVRVRWQNRRKPGRFNTADIERDQRSHMPGEGQYDRSADHWPDSRL